GFKAEAGRYHLYVAHGCPWAHRTLIYRSIKKLEGAITVAYAIPGLRQQGWTFEDDPAFPDCTPDSVNGFRYLHQAYTATDPRYTGKVTVPTLWDTKSRRIVNNESSEIIRMLNSEFEGIAGDGADFYPQPMRAEIDRLNDIVYANVNNGVYRCGFASRRPPTKPPTTRCSPLSTNSKRDWRASATCSAGQSRKPIGVCFPRWCASMSPIFHCFDATRSGSQTTPISRTTCATSTRCPASPT